MAANPNGRTEEKEQTPATPQAAGDTPEAVAAAAAKAAAKAEAEAGTGGKAKPVRPGNAKVAAQKKKDEGAGVNKSLSGLSGMSEGIVSSLMKGNVNTNLEALVNIERAVNSRAGHQAIKDRYKKQQEYWTNYAENKDKEFVENAKSGNFEYGGFWMGDRKWNMLGKAQVATPLENGIEKAKTDELNGWISEITSGKNSKGEARAGKKFDLNKLPKGLIMYNSDGKAELDTSKITTQEQLNAVMSMMKSDRKGQVQQRETAQKEAEAASKKAGADVIDHLVSTGLSREDAVKRVNGMSNDTVKVISESLTADRDATAQRAKEAEAERVRRQNNIASAKDATGSFLDGNIDEDTWRKAINDAGVSTQAMNILKRAREAIDAAAPVNRGNPATRMDDMRMHPENHPEIEKPELIQEVATPKNDEAPTEPAEAPLMATPEELERESADTAHGLAVNLEDERRTKNGEAIRSRETIPSGPLSGDAISSFNQRLSAR